MARSDQFQSVVSYDLTATIAAGQDESHVIDLSGCVLAGLFLPANFNGTTVTLLASTAPDGTFVPVQDGEGADFTITGDESRYAPVNDYAIVAGLRYIKLKAGTSQSGSDTVITLATRPV